MVIWYPFPRENVIIVAHERQLSGLQSISGMHNLLSLIIIIIFPSDMKYIALGFPVLCMYICRIYCIYVSRIYVYIYIWTFSYTNNFIVKMWIEIIESKIDVECSQSVFKHNLKQCLIEKIICLHCSKMQWWFVVFFLLFCLTFLMQANQIPFVTLCCTFGTINEIVWSESDIGTHKPKRFQSPLSHTSVSTTEYVIWFYMFLFELTAKLICLCALPW